MALLRLSLPRMKLLRLMPLLKRERKKVYFCTRFCSFVISLDRIRHNRRVWRSVLTLSWICECCYREGCTWVLAYSNEDKWGFGHAGEFKSTLRFPVYFLAFPSASVMFGVWWGTPKMFFCYTIFGLCIGQGLLYWLPSTFDRSLSVMKPLWKLWRILNGLILKITKALNLTSTLTQTRTSRIQWYVYLIEVVLCSFWDCWMWIWQWLFGSFMHSVSFPYEGNLCDWQLSKTYHMIDDDEPILERAVG